MPKFGHLGSIFSKANVKFEISSFKIGYMRNFVKIRKSILFGWFWVVLQFFEIVWVVSAGFGWLQPVLAGFGSFLLVPGFSKYAGLAWCPRSNTDGVFPETEVFIFHYSSYFR